MIQEFYKRELEVVTRRDFRKHPVIEFGFFFRNDLKSIRLRTVFSKIFEKEHLEEEVSPVILQIIKRRIRAFKEHHFPEKTQNAQNGKIEKDIDFTETIETIF